MHNLCPNDVLARQEHGGNLTQSAKLLNKESPDVLIVTDADYFPNTRQLVVLSHMLKPTIKLSVLKEPSVPILSAKATHFYAYHTAPRFNRYWENTGIFTLTPVGDSTDLIRVDRK